MGFWLFITVMDLIIPVFMIGLGILFIKRPPVKVNHWYGYRTRMSMKNRDTWDFAHRYAGKIWLITGWIILLVTIPVMLMFLGKRPGDCWYSRRNRLHRSKYPDGWGDCSD